MISKYHLQKHTHLMPSTVTTKNSPRELQKALLARRYQPELPRLPLLLPLSGVCLSNQKDLAEMSVHPFC